MMSPGGGNGKKNDEKRPSNPKQPEKFVSKNAKTGGNNSNGSSSSSTKDNRPPWNNSFSNNSSINNRKQRSQSMSAVNISPSTPDQNGSKNANNSMKTPISKKKSDGRTGTSLPEAKPSDFASADPPSLTKPESTGSANDSKLPRLRTNVFYERPINHKQLPSPDVKVASAIKVKGSKLPRPINSPYTPKMSAETSELRKKRKEMKQQIGSTKKEKSSSAEEDLSPHVSSSPRQVTIDPQDEEGDLTPEHLGEYDILQPMSHEDRDGQKGNEEVQVAEAVLVNVVRFVERQAQNVYRSQGVSAGDSMVTSAQPIPSSVIESTSNGTNTNAEPMVTIVEPPSSATTPEPMANMVEPPSSTTTPKPEPMANMVESMPNVTIPKSEPVVNEADKGDAKAPTTPEEPAVKEPIQTSPHDAIPTLYVDGEDSQGEISVTQKVAIMKHAAVIEEASAVDVITSTNSDDGKRVLEEIVENVEGFEGEEHQFSPSPVIKQLTTIEEEKTDEIPPSSSVSSRTSTFASTGPEENSAQLQSRTIPKTSQETNVQSGTQSGEQESEPFVWGGIPVPSPGWNNIAGPSNVDQWVPEPGTSDIQDFIRQMMNPSTAVPIETVDRSRQFKIEFVKVDSNGNVIQITSKSNKEVNEID